MREVLKSMYYGRIYRDGTQTLKKCGIGQNAHVLCEILSEEVERYPDSKVLIYLKKRVPKTGSYEPMRMEFVDIPGPHPTLVALMQACAKVFGLDPANTAVAKYIPYKFTWTRIVPPTEEVAGKSRRKKKAKAADDITQAPYFFREGGTDQVGITGRYHRGPRRTGGGRQR